MKKLSLPILLGAAMCMSANAKSYMKVEMTDGESYTYNVSKVSQITFVEEEDAPQGGVTISGSIGKHTYVDLGLESGTLWATYNIGTETPLERGDRFAWGETKVKPVYNKTTYAYYDADADKYSKYNDLNGVLAPEDDAATAQWGAAWCMPTDAQWKELIAGCTWKTVTDYNESGVKGVLGVSKSNPDATIFFPATGFTGGSHVDGYCYYWSSTIANGVKPNSASNAGYWSQDTHERYAGLCIRPVACPATKYVATVSGQVDKYGYVDMGLPSGNLWAVANVGYTESKLGGYYAWGEVVEKDYYDGSLVDYKWFDFDTKEIIKYNSQTDYTLELDDDVAANYTSGAFSMPTKADMDELIDNCTWVWVSNYNDNMVAGMAGVSKTNGAIIFFPAAGQMEDDQLDYDAERGFYWTATGAKSYPYQTASCMRISYSNGKARVIMSTGYKCLGNSVRGVIRK